MPKERGCATSFHRIPTRCLRERWSKRFRPEDGKTAYCVRGFHEKACRCQEKSFHRPLGDRTRGLALLWGEPPVLAALGGTHPPRLSLWETGKGNLNKSPFLAAAGRFDCSALISSLSFRNRRFAMLPFALVVESVLRCQLVSFFLKRVLLSQCRTELSLSRELVPPRTRSHPNSTWLRLTQKFFSLRLLAASLALPLGAPGYCAMAGRPPPSPTSGAAGFPACALQPPAPVSWHSCRRAHTTSLPNASDPCPVLAAPECNALPAPAASADTHHLLC